MYRQGKSKIGISSMISDGTSYENLRGAFSLDSTASEVAVGAYRSFEREWSSQFGNDFRLPAFNAATTTHFRVKSRGARIDNVVMVDLYGASAVRTGGTLHGEGDQVRMYLMQRGAWTLDRTRSSDEYTVRAGQFMLRNFVSPPHFSVAPHTTARMLFLPSAILKPLVGRRFIGGPVDSAETRLLLAHVNMTYEVIAELGPSGIYAARDAMIELVKAVVLRRFDDAEPLLAPALAQAAKEYVDRHLAQHELSSAVLARELNVSVRTLQRSFAGVGESVTEYIRRRRLEEARLALSVPSPQRSISELAAYWHFADSSHFIRAFKKSYGQTPMEYARSANELVHDKR